MTPPSGGVVFLAMALKPCDRKGYAISIGNRLILLINF